MKSIKELSKELNCNPIELNKIFVRNKIYVGTEFGIEDGFIGSELSDFIKLGIDNRINNSLTYNEILDIKSILIPIKDASYVYFLINENKIVYVGQSNVLLSRIGNHLVSEKTFDEISVIETDSKKLNDVEQFYIYLFNPPLNLVKYGIIDIIRAIVKEF